MRVRKRARVERGVGGVEGGVEGEVEGEGRRERWASEMERERREDLPHVCM